MSALVQTIGDVGLMSFRIDATGLQAVIDGMPKAAYFSLRDFLGRAFLQHRKRWLATKSTKFGRGSKNGRAIRVTQLNEGSGALADNEVRYTVLPKERRMPTPAAAAAALKLLEGDVGTGNKVLEVHELGTDIVSADPMYIPVKTRPGDFGDWRRANPNKQLLFLPSKRDNKTLVYEVIRRRVRRKRDPATGKLVGEGGTRETLRLRFVVTKRVEMKPTLKLYDSWDAGASERDQLFTQAANRMQSDLLKRDPRDL